MDNSMKTNILDLLKENQDTDILQTIVDWADSPKDRYAKARRWVDINDAMKKAIQNTSELAEIYILINNTDSDNV
jgi:hypothetical protein